MSQPPPPPPPPLTFEQPLAMDAQARRWAEAASKLEISALSDVRGLAEKWAAALTSALAVVGLAALIEGAKTFDKLDDPWKGLAKLSFVVAAVLALIATALATLAAQGTSKRVFIPGGSAIREYATTAVETALGFISASRWLAGAAAAAVLLAAGLLWFAPRAGSEPTVVEIQGSQLCPAGATIVRTSDADYVIRCRR
jgi:hypothetical protein